MTTLTILRAGPLMSVQDAGRPGLMSQGLSVGGAADGLALIEGAALLGLPAPGQAIEMAGVGGQFRADAPTRFALTGAAMKADLDGVPLDWNASHILLPGAVLTIGGVLSGTYGYLSFPGGIIAASQLGSVATHFQAGIGVGLGDGDELQLGDDPDPLAPSLGIRVDPRSTGGRLRLMPGLQTALFEAETRDDFAARSYTRDPIANRQGVRLDSDGPRIQSDQASGLASDFIRPGDVQMTGDGVPYVLLGECQTMGGYPRIGTVVAADLPLVAQAGPGAVFRFDWVEVAEADALTLPNVADLRAQVFNRLRDPADIGDLLSYQLISGVISAHQSD